MGDETSHAGRSAMRALDVLRAYRDARRPLSLTELSQRAEMPVSTCHGVVKRLLGEGWLYLVSGRDLYPTRRLWDLADTLRRHDPIALRLEPALAALRDDVDETVILGARQGEAVVYLLVLESAQAIRYSSAAGDRKPLHSSSIGKVMLGQMAPAALDAWLAAHRLDAMTERTMTSADALRADLVRSASRGWYATRGENVRDVMALAAPLRLGGSVLGVAVAGPLPRIEASRDRLATRLLDCARALETRHDG
jgi:DNA-binding IclR family transcriptional regulator